MLDRKAWKSDKGDKISFAKKFLVFPFTQNGQLGFDQVDPESFTLVERLYKIRSKVTHEGKPYYVEDSIAVSVTSADVETMLQAADKTLTWIEAHP